MLMDGVEMNPLDISNTIGYVPQDDFLIGELSPREMLSNTAIMKLNKPTIEIDKDVTRLLEAFGLKEVADNTIGTVFVRGLSGGQRRRVDIGTELIASPRILFLDEPTSGLDGSIAFEVLSSIRSLVKASGGKLSIMLSIHQPNSRILELFDQIMLIGGGGMLFFGTVPEASSYFTDIGFPPPENFTPTDFYLKISDKDFGTQTDYDFEGSFYSSRYCTKLIGFLDTIKRRGADAAINEVDETDLKNLDSGMVAVSRHMGACFCRQYCILFLRDLKLALRDPSLYLLQFILVLAFGFLIGAAFFQRSIEIDAKMNNIVAALLWIVFMMCYIQVFKVYHLSQSNHRFRHERANNTYGVLAYFFAELTVSSLFLLSFIPGAAIAYFMAGFPGEAFPFLLFTFWMTALTAETMLNFISKFSKDTTINVVTCQATFVILTVFGGGVFIPWNQTPSYWVWLQELSIFTQASRATFVSVMDVLQYKCTLTSGACVGPLGDIFACDAKAAVGNVCFVKGRTVLQVLQGTSPTDNKWTSFGYLVLIFAVFRLGALLLLYFPVERLWLSARQWWSGSLVIDLIGTKVELRKVSKQLTSFMAEVHGQNSSEKKNMRRQASMKMVEDVAPEVDVVDVEGGMLDFESQGLLPRHACLTWTNIDVTLGNGKKLIDNCTGVAKSGKILALMGPSGAGKTTLLNALGKRAPYATVTGNIEFGNRPFLSSDLYFVPQFDELNGELTVWELIELTGRLKCRETAAITLRLRKLIRILGLVSKSHSLVKTLSGGELKRVSVGMGMITAPNTLFLDEPTTGLDSSAAFSLVTYLVDMAKNTDVAVIMTIHQPSEMVFDMLQDLMLLESGRLAYFGSLPATKEYFKKVGYTCPKQSNPADFYLDLIYKPPVIDPSKGWKQLYEDSHYAAVVTHKTKQILAVARDVGASDDTPSDIVRFQETLVFFIKYYTRAIGFYYLRLAFMVLVALFIGTLFLDLKTNTKYLADYSGVIFINIWTVLFSAVTATGLLASARRQAVEQVKNAVMTPQVYCLAQFVASVPFNFLISLVFQSILHWMTNLNPQGEPFIYAVLVTCAHLLLMEGFMLLVVQVLHNAMLSVTFAMVIMGYLFLFSGFFVKVVDMPAWISWISYIVPTKYSFDGYVYQIFHSQTFDINGQPGATMTGDQILDQIFSQTGVKPWIMFLVLLAWVALVRLGHCAVFLLEVHPFMRGTKARL